MNCLNWSCACRSVSRQCRSGVGVCRLTLVSDMSIVSKCQLTLVSKCRARAQPIGRYGAVLPQVFTATAATQPPPAGRQIWCAGQGARGRCAEQGVRGEDSGPRFPYGFRCRRHTRPVRGHMCGAESRWARGVPFGLSECLSLIIDSLGSLKAALLSLPIATT